MTALTPEIPVETQKSFLEPANAHGHDVRVPMVESATAVERHERPAVTTIKEPGIITFQISRTIPETKVNFLSDVAHLIRDAAFQTGITGPVRPLYGNSNVLSPREKAEQDAALMGIPQF